MTKQSKNSEVRTQILLFCVLCSVFCVISGCGYSTRSLISNEFKTIYIQPFINKVDVTQEAYAGDRYRIYKPLLETDITKSVINKFLQDGNLKPQDEQYADLILKGELVDFRRDPLRYSDNDDVLEYRINLVVNISLSNKQKNLVWKEDGFTGATTYFTSGTQAKSEDTAINDAVSDLARRIVERTVEYW